MKLESESMLQPGIPGLMKLYDSASFLVVAQDHPDNISPFDRKFLFEIVDKRTFKEVLLNGSWAEVFQRKVSDWQLITPTLEEVEACLDEFASLAQIPLLVH